MMFLCYSQQGLEHFAAVAVTPFLLDVNVDGMDYQLIIAFCRGDADLQTTEAEKQHVRVCPIAASHD